ncbi:hypothetical protein acdb102_23970 [Acidothermaceae bacterium B102]|nr:hypothetical protein acdb102_23970 [Acidothermaceae bacterium B102]
MNSTLQLRRAALADIPAVARLLLPSASPSVGGVMLSRQTAAGALRLALSHVGLDTGGVWVVEEGGAVVSATALLPPHGAVDDGGLLLALRLELGLRTALVPPRLSDGVPAEHWLLLVHEASGSVLERLIDEVLPAADDSVIAVVCLASAAPQALLSRGFVPAQEGVLVRPAARWPAVAL